MRQLCDNEQEELTSVRLDRVVQQYLPRKDGFHEESEIGVALRLLGNSVRPFLETGFEEDLHLQVILRDRTLHHFDVEIIRNNFLDLRHRANAGIEKLAQRMTIEVDELDAAWHARQAALENEGDSPNGKAVAVAKLPTIKGQIATSSIKKAAPKAVPY